MTKSFAAVSGFNRTQLKISGASFAWTDQSWTQDGLLLFYKSPELEVTRSFRLEPGAYYLKTTDQIVNRGAGSLDLSVDVGVSEEVHPHQQSGFFMRILKPQTEFQKSLWFQKDALDYEMFDKTGESKF